MLVAKQLHTSYRTCVLSFGVDCWVLTYWFGFLSLQSFSSTGRFVGSGFILNQLKTSINYPVGSPTLSLVFSCFPTVGIGSSVAQYFSRIFQPSATVAYVIFTFLFSSVRWSRVLLAFCDCRRASLQYVPKVLPSPPS